LTTVDETNKRNETFSNYAVSKVGMVKDRSVYEDAKIFRQSVASGDVKAKDVDQVSVDEEPKDEIPF
jgi:deoxyadenosine/deoxycytidine kinase